MTLAPRHPLCIPCPTCYLVVDFPSQTSPFVLCPTWPDSTIPALTSVQILFAIVVVSRWAILDFTRHLARRYFEGLLSIQWLVSVLCRCYGQASCRRQTLATNINTSPYEAGRPIKLAAVPDILASCTRDKWPCRCQHPEDT